MIEGMLTIMYKVGLDKFGKKEKKITRGTGKKPLKKRRQSVITTEARTVICDKKIEKIK